MAFNRFFFLLPTILFLSCSTGSHFFRGIASDSPLEDEVILVDLPLGKILEPEDKKYSRKYSEKDVLIEKIRSKQALSSGELISVILEDNIKMAHDFGTVDSEITVQDIVEWILSTIKEAPKKDLGSLKVHSEKKMEKGSKNKIDYNSQATSIVNMFKDQKLQCHSGTIFNAVTYKLSMQGKQDTHKAVVAIFEPGHVLPGFIVKENGNFRLYGIESTLSGPAIVDYGPTQNLHKDLLVPIRVVLINDFLVLEAIKSQLNLNVNEVAKLVEFATQKLDPWGLNTLELEKRVHDPKNFRQIAVDESLHGRETFISEDNVRIAFPTSQGKLNVHPLAFGALNPVEGDLNREYLEFGTPIKSKINPVRVSWEDYSSLPEIKTGFRLSSWERDHETDRFFYMRFLDGPIDPRDMIEFNFTFTSPTDFFPPRLDDDCGFNLELYRHQPHVYPYIDYAEWRIRYDGFNYLTGKERKKKIDNYMMNKELTNDMNRVERESWINYADAQGRPRTYERVRKRYSDSIEPENMKLPQYLMEFLMRELNEAKEIYAKDPFEKSKVVARRPISCSHFIDIVASHRKWSENKKE